MTAINYLASDNINHTPVSTANPLPVTGSFTASSVGAATFAPGANPSLAGTSGLATLIVAARAGGAGTGRVSVTIVNNSTTVLTLGPTAGITSGLILPGVVGASITLATTSAIYGYVPSGSASISWYELY